jgi:iron complex outermembrane recepter protein
VPKFSGSAYGQYAAPFSGSRSWFARADMTYIGKRYDSIVNTAWVPGQFRTNLRAGLTSDRWELVTYVNNVLDDDTLEAARFLSDTAADPTVFQLAASEAVLASKRQLGITATVRF